MNSYELMFIVHPSEDEGEGVDAHIERVGRLIVDHGGEVTGVDKWGKRRFAYPIDDLTEGHYVVMTFKANASLVDEVGRVLRLTDLIMRHLIVRLDEDVVQQEETVGAEGDQSEAERSEGGQAEGEESVEADADAATFQSEASDADSEADAAPVATESSDENATNAEDATAGDEPEDDVSEASKATPEQ